MSIQAPTARSRSEETDERRVLRDARGLFQPGTAPGPGRYPQGRKASIDVLDEMLAETGNREKLRKALQREFDRSPVAFFRRIIMPLLPKTALLGIVDGGGEALVKFIAGIREDRL